MTKDFNTALLLGLLKTNLSRDRIFFLHQGRRRIGDPTLLDMTERELSREEFSKHCPCFYRVMNLSLKHFDHLNIKRSRMRYCSVCAIVTKVFSNLLTPSST